MLNTHIIAIGLAVPPVKMPQKEMAEFMAKILNLNSQETRKLKVIYRATAIENRYSVLNDFSLQGISSFYKDEDAVFPSTSERMKIYEQEAIKYAQIAAEKCITQATQNHSNSFSKTDITHLITVSCTGMYAPGIDIELIERLGLSYSVQRTAINFMGCYASFNGFKVADAICKSNPEAKVLMVGVELCTLHLQKSAEDDDLISNAIFGDGAGAVLFEANSQAYKSLKLESFFCGLLPSGKKEMAWNINDTGFLMRLSSYVPDFLEKGVNPLIGQLLKQMNLKMEDIKHFALHPGGRRILEGIEQSLKISKEQNQASYEILRNYGNMSSVTILFVLQYLWQDLNPSQHQEKILSMAFGPGLTLESALLSVHFKAKD
jgi:predicted naringenin-chalcone synthase